MRKPNRGWVAAVSVWLGAAGQVGVAVGVGTAGPGVEFEPRSAEVKMDVRIQRARVPAVLLKDAAPGLAQQIELVLQYTGEPVGAVIKAGADVRQSVQLHAGEQTVTLTIPAVDAPASVPVAVEVGGRTIAQQDVLVRPVRRWVVYLLPHSHNDIGYTHLQAEVERKQWEYLEQAIEAARRTAGYPEGARFKWNVEVMWAVDGYLRQASPEQQQTFVDAVKVGWVELDALYGNELTALCRPEELVRLVECAGQVARRCGVPLESAMINDVPGYTWGMVPVLAQAGVRYFTVGPNPSDRIGGTLAVWGDRPFYWIGPSGADRVLCWIAGTGYGFFHRSGLDAAAAARMLAHLEHLDTSGYPYEIVHMRYGVGGDNGPPDPGVCEFVRTWNETHAAPRLVIATATEMCRAFERRYGDRLPEFRGDFTPYWEDGAASSARETGLNRAAAERLVQAETLCALRAPANYPAAAFADAWRNVLLYDEHTWGAWNSVNEPDAAFVRDQWRVKEAFALDGDRQSRALLSRALDYAATDARPVAAVDVYNTSSWPRTDLVTLPAEVTSAGDAVLDAAGRAVPSQRLSTGELVFVARDVPPLAAARFTLSDNPAPPTGAARAEGNVLTSAQLRVVIDERTGAIVSLRGAAVPDEFVDTSSAVALNGYLYMLGSDAAGAQPNGPVSIRVRESGPLVAALWIESAAPGCRTLVRELRIVDGLERVEIANIVDKQPMREKEGVHFGFAFEVPDGVLRMDIPWAVVRPEVDQLPGACRNWFTVQRWVDVSNATRGVTWATLDAPLIEVGGLTADRIGSLPDPNDWRQHVVPSQTFYSWVMNNHWHTNYKAEQEGPTVFRYFIRPHAAFDSAAAQRFGIECSQPLLAVPARGTRPSAEPRLRVAPDSVIVTALKPSADGRAWLLRLFNPSEEPVRATLTWGTPAPRVVRRCNLLEEPGDEVAGPLDLPAWGLATLRCETQRLGAK